MSVLERLGASWSGPARRVLSPAAAGSTVARPVLALSRVRGVEALR